MTVTVDCPWCSAPVALGDEDRGLACDACGVVADLGTDEPLRLATLVPGWTGRGRGASPARGDGARRLAGPYDASMDIGEASDALIRAGRRLGARGLISAGEGNLSIRLDGSRILVTPSGRRRPMT